MDNLLHWLFQTIEFKSQIMQLLNILSKATSETQQMAMLS